MRKTFCMIALALLVVGFQATQVVWVDAVGGVDSADGSINPVKTIKRGIEIARGINQRGLPVIVRLRPGVYRETLTWRSTTDASVTIEAEHHGQAIISGADVWSDGWRVDGRLLVHEWTPNWGLSPIPQGWISNGLNVNVADIVRRRELVLVDGVRLNQTLQPGGLGVAGTFYVDEGNNTVTINPPTSTPGVAPLHNGEGGKIEVGVRERVLDVQNSKNVTVRGLVFTGAASHFDQAGAVINNVIGLLLEDNQFRLNGAGGLGVSRSSGTLRRNVYDNNGSTGLGGAYNRDMLIEGDSATGNNWRGASGGFLGWSVAGIKLLHLRRMEFRDVRACGNHTVGLWLDSDFDAIISRLNACNNQTYGLYLEATQGPIVLRDSVISGNKSYGILISSVRGLTMTGARIEDNGGAGIWIGGSVPRRSVWNFETDKYIELPPASNITLTDNVICGRSEANPAFFYATGEFNESFQPTYKAERNRWCNADGSRPFREGNRYDLAGWQVRTGQDKGSVMGTPIANIPTSTATPSATRTPEPIYLTPDPSPTWRGDPTPDVTATPEMRLVERIEVWWDGDRLIVDRYAP